MKVYLSEPITGLRPARPKAGALRSPSDSSTPVWKSPIQVEKCPTTVLKPLNAE